MGDGLQVEAQLEAALNQIADENGEEDGDEAMQQVIVLHQNGITDAAHHAQAGLLGQSAHHQSDEQGDDGGGVHGAGACLAGVEDGGDCQHQHQQHKHHHGKGGALHQLGGIGALEAEATLEEQDTDDNADDEAGQTNQSIQVAATHTQNHPQGAAEKHQCANHNEGTQHEPGGRGGTGLRTELLTGQSHDEGTQH